MAKHQSTTRFQLVIGFAWLVVACAVLLLARSFLESAPLGESEGGARLLLMIIIPILLLIIAMAMEVARRKRMGIEPSREEVRQADTSSLDRS